MNYVDLTHIRWAFGQNWDIDGEVDIIEGVHEATTNLVSLHVAGSEGVCTLVSSQQSGVVKSGQCDNAITDNTGCGVSGGSYGMPFNNNGGGICKNLRMSEVLG